MSTINHLSYVTKQYVNHLTETLQSPYYKYFYNIFQEIKNKTGRQRLSKFQKVLIKMSKWNQDLIDTEMQNFIETNELDYLGDLLTAIFVSMTKMMSFNQRDDHITINLMVPKDTKFLYICLKEISREIFVYPFLFQDYDLPHFEIQRNLKETNRIIKKSIERVIRRLLPMKIILDAYLGKLLEKKKSKSKKYNKEPSYIEQDDTMTINSYIDDSKEVKKPNLDDIVKQQLKEVKNIENIKDPIEKDVEKVFKETKMKNKDKSKKTKKNKMNTENNQDIKNDNNTNKMIDEIQKECVQFEPSNQLTNASDKDGNTEDLNADINTDINEDEIENEEKVIPVDSHPELINEEKTNQAEENEKNIEEDDEESDVEADNQENIDEEKNEADNEENIEEDNDEVFFEDAKKE